MPKHKYPMADDNPAAKLTDRIADSLRDQSVEDMGEPAGEGQSDLGRIDTYLYWNAFDEDRPK